MFSLPGSKKKAEAAKNAALCPMGKECNKDNCSMCEHKPWCPTAAPSLEFVSVPNDIRRFI